MCVCPAVSFAFASLPHRMANGILVLFMIFLFVSCLQNVCVYNKKALPHDPTLHGQRTLLVANELIKKKTRLTSVVHVLNRTLNPFQSLPAIMLTALFAFLQLRHCRIRPFSFLFLLGPHCRPFSLSFSNRLTQQSRENSSEPNLGTTLSLSMGFDNRVALRKEWATDNRTRYVD